MENKSKVGITSIIVLDIRHGLLMRLPLYCLVKTFDEHSYYFSVIIESLTSI